MVLVIGVIEVKNVTMTGLRWYYIFVGYRAAWTRILGFGFALI